MQNSFTFVSTLLAAMIFYDAEVLIWSVRFRNVRSLPLFSKRARLVRLDFLHSLLFLLVQFHISLLACRIRLSAFSVYLPPFLSLSNIGHLSFLCSAYLVLSPHNFLRSFPRFLWFPSAKLALLMAKYEIARYELKAEAENSRRFYQNKQQHANQK